ncbi:putative baseplate assembly protein [Azohydromonas caseinilytica]|uniref:Putative baseplate assembly protein n=1 Tax=Azohydromonas caseinilytica TaxID=2728836 RepID=A0A848FBY5_9BURK|nr:putative baseplate assembly protein [Azohydromonas caseinilytica]NML16832.1 putative baseplate assembly protein [Azohydromonas caseinilytica]
MAADAVLHPERLIARARALDGKLANGLRLAYLTLDPADPPRFAWLDVEFFTDHQLSPLPPREIFEVQGGVRRGRAAVAVTQVLPDPGGSLTALRLKLEPVGDYSIYTLSTRQWPPGTAADPLAAVMDPLFNRLAFKFRPGCFNVNCAPEASPAPAEDTAPAIDYLARDYDSFRHVLMAAMAQRVRGWAPTSEADLDQVLIDLIAARGDELADAHDRVLAERALGTARKRVSLARHARLVDYHVHQGNQATTLLALEVAAPTELPPNPADDCFAVWSGKDWNAPGAVVFATLRGPGRWRRLVFPGLNRLTLYTWDDTVSALERGATSADLCIDGDTSEAQARLLQDLLRNATAAQTGAPEDVDAAVERLLIEERLNPETGTANGRRTQQRQPLTLLPGEERATAMEDPVRGRWFCRVRWRAEDALRERYCFVLDCDDTLVRDATVFCANLMDVAHGRPRVTTFVPEGQALEGDGGDTGLVARHGAHWSALRRPLGAGWVDAGAEAWLPRDPSIEPLAWHDTPPGGEEPPRSTLVVEVSGYAQPWSEHIDLIESDGSGEHFVVECDEAQDARIRFGDGVNGAPLPPGAKLVCRYQSGQGEAGNVGCDTLVSASVPVQRVWNPFDVRNGREPEPRESIVRRAPEAFRLRQRRAVTLDDYAAAARRIEGVAQARARHAWCGSWRAVQVVVDPVGGGEPGADLVARLAAALDALRLIGDDVEIRAPAYVPLDIRLALCAHPGYWVEDLRFALEAEFSDGHTPDGRAGFFHPDAWSFGQPLHASRLIGRALAVPGVERVLRVSMRRFNPGVGGGLVTVELAPDELPEQLDEVLPIGPFEILVVANDPDRLERGRIALDIRGGRR